MSREGNGKSSTGAIVGGAAAGFAGAKGGAALGTVLIPVPVFGTVVGALAGGLFGLIRGSRFGAEHPKAAMLGAATLGVGMAAAPLIGEAGQAIAQGVGEALDKIG